MIGSLALLLAILFGFADSLCGGRPKTGVRGVYIVAFVAIVILASSLAFGLPALLVSSLLAAFIVWREPAWWNGSLAPTPSQVPSTILRHALSLAFVVPLVTLAHVPVMVAVLGMSAFTLIATGLAILHRHLADKGKDVNNIIEPVRGGILGLIVAGLISGLLTI